MFATPSLYTIYEQPPRLDGAVVLGISQSGASPDVASVLAEARRQGRPTVALTNVAGLAARQRGRRRAAARGGRGALGRRDEDVHELARRDRACSSRLRTARCAEAELERMPRACSRSRSRSRSSRRRRSGSTRDAVGATVVARGVNYGTAFEIALKIRELSGLVVEAYSPADLMHGPIAAIRRGLAGDRRRADRPGAAERRRARAAAARARRAHRRDLRRRGRAAPRAARSCRSCRGCRSG